jgi:hypothetical protein
MNFAAAFLFAPSTQHISQRPNPPKLFNFGENSLQGPVVRVIFNLERKSGPGLDQISKCDHLSFFPSDRAKWFGLISLDVCMGHFGHI